jgi:hypothetical protein
MGTECPTPAKSRYATREAAESAARRVAIAVQPALYPYTCPCGWWHLTSNPQPDVLVVDQLEPGDGDETLLHNAPDMLFREVVLRDIRGRATREEALSLRHALNLQRWRRVLKDVWLDTERQMKAKSGIRTAPVMEWRRRASAYQAQVRERRAEAYRRSRALSGEGSQKLHHEHLRRQVVDADVQEKRRMAGDIAKDRLIGLYRDDFVRLVAEECERLGVAPADSIRSAVAELDARGEAA